MVELAQELRQRVRGARARLPGDLHAPPTGGRPAPATTAASPATTRCGSRTTRPARRHAAGGWGFYTFWQYADSGSQPGDQDVFNGAYTQLKVLAVNG